MDCNRRKFIITLIYVFLFSSFKIRAGNRKEINISNFTIRLPAWLFNIEQKNSKNIKLLRMTKKNGSNIFVIFEKGIKVKLNQNTSVNLLLQENKNKYSRNSIMLKRLISNSLVAVSEVIHTKRNYKSKKSLISEFRALQDEDTLTAITINDMFCLFDKLQEDSFISNIYWDVKTSRLIIE